MKKNFSVAWKRSRQPRKQRKFAANAPLHIKRKLLSARLSKELTTKHGTRSIPLRKGDKVKVVRGQYSGKTGKIDVISAKKQRIYVDGIERTKTDNTKSLYPIHPSNVIVQEIVLDDKKRKIVLERRKKQ